MIIGAYRNSLGAESKVPEQVFLHKKGPRDSRGIRETNWIEEGEVHETNGRRGYSI